ncbi:MAG: tRNA lysidine(34) synthetase TilS [Hyphomicrobiales bacterium]|nr:tRNA lysidine(34) synthetase TilS [Hyphomicrobiales bacterium]
MGIADQAIRDDEANALFSGLEEVPGLLLAVSGGSDSTALLLLAARWAGRLKKRRKRSPKLLAVTVDHGLRSESAREAKAVGRLARRLGVRHAVVRWRDAKPKTGLQEAARHARYRLLAQAAVRAGCEHVLTAHTLDDQAETVLFRLARGSGLTGLAGMAHALPIPIGEESAVFLVRPLLGVAKVRLVATLRGARVTHSEDPSNRDPRFARTRIRLLLAQLAQEGLDARAIARLAARMRRAETTIEFVVAAACDALAPRPWQSPVVFDAMRFNDLPAEVGLRLLGRAVAHVGNEGPVELGKLELLYEALRKARVPLRRTLAGALVAAGGGRIVVERAPSRRQAGGRSGNRRFTK